uniref:Putative triabin-like lipocalin 4a n=1 Tax=Panstrongylus megistus TaxID=65343 RepID=A0A069DPZ2_9HEMI
MKRIIGLTFFAILTYVHAYSAGIKECPKKEAMANFDSTKYFTGTWYVTHAKNGSESTVCREFNYKSQNDGTLEVNATRYKKKDSNDYFYLDKCKGSEKSGEKGKFSLECTREYEGLKKPNKMFHVERTVIQTDYDNYAVVYRCVTPKDANSQLKDDIWVLHRDKDKEDSRISSVLEANGWSLTDFRSRKNFECKERSKS